MKNRFLFVIMLLLSCMGAAAQSTLTLEDVLTKVGQWVTIPVMMDNQDEVVAVEFTIAMPEGNCWIETDQCELAAGRSAGHQLTIAQRWMNGRNVYKVTIFSATNNAIKGNSGRLMTLKAYVPDNWEDEETYEIEVSKIKLSSPAAKNVATKQEGVCDITIDNSPHCDLVLTVNEVSPSNIKPGEELTVDYTITNTGDADANRAGWIERLTLMDENGNNYTCELGSYYGALVVNASRQERRVVTLPKTFVLDGQITVIVEVEGSRNLNELSSTKENNVVRRDNAILVPRSLSLGLRAEEVLESSKILFGTVVRSGNTSRKADVLLWSDNDRVQAPDVVTIPAGQTSATFQLTIVDDEVRTGDVKVNIVAEAQGYESAVRELTVIDDDQPEAEMGLSVNQVTEGEKFFMKIRTKETFDKDVVFTVASNAAARVSHAKNVTLEAGSNIVEVEVTAIDDDEPSLSQKVTFTLSASGFKPASGDVWIMDNDVPALELTLDKTQITEADGPQAIKATLKRSDAKNRITVAVDEISSLANLQLTLADRFITMPAGQETVDFYVGVKDNKENEGTREVRLQAAVWFASCKCGAEEGKTGYVLSSDITIVDDDSPMLKLTSDKTTIPEGASTLLKVVRNGALTNALSIKVTSDADDLFEGYDHERTIEVNKDIYTFNIIAKKNIPEGGKVVTFTVEADEFAEGKCQITVSAEKRPDLAVRPVVVADSAEVGTTPEVKLVVVNEGFASSKGGEKIEILSSVKDVYFSNSVQVLATVDVKDAIVEGDSITLPKTIELPKSTGQIYLYARIVDADYNASNNISSASPLFITAPFVVTLTTDVASVGASEVVNITGSGSGKVENVKTQIYYIYNGNTYNLQEATTNKEGRFNVQWVAPASAPGMYSFGCCYDKPSASDSRVEVEVKGLKLAYSGTDADLKENFVYQEVTLGEEVTGTFAIQNPGKTALTDIEMEVTGAPKSWTRSFEVPASIEGGKTAVIKYSIKPGSVTVGKQTLTLNIKAAGTSMLTLKGKVGCKAGEPKLGTDMARLSGSISTGSEREYSVMLVNTGGATTGKLSFSMPDEIALVTPINAVAPGDTVTAVLRVSSANYKSGETIFGTMSICPEFGDGVVMLPYSFTVKASAPGTMEFRLCDENTYYGEEEDATVQKATIVMENMATGDKMVTDKIKFDIPEGYYNYTISAPGHATATGTVLVNPGETTKRTVNMSMTSNVDITYKIVETEEEDGYEIVTEATFQTNIPLPLVTISVPGRIYCDDLGENESLIVPVTVENRGLLAAKNLTLSLPQTSDWTWEALSATTFDLKPAEKAVVNIQVTRCGTSDDDDCTAYFDANYSWTCGDETVNRAASTVSVIKKHCKPTLRAEFNVVTPIEENGKPLAEVKMQFAQTMTMTRQGFEGTLTIKAGVDLSDITLDLIETAADGAVATAREFDITIGKVEGFVDNTIADNWKLAAGKTGTVVVKYIPTKYAAPVEAVDYNFGGMLSFEANGKTLRNKLADQVLTVKPSPELNLTYFLQRDVFGDDPLTTDVKEESQPAEFALLINNIGAGDANNVSLVTPQPQIVENKNNVDIKMEFVASQLNGLDKALALGGTVATQFGTIAAGSQAYAQWWMTSTQLGHFIEYDVQYARMSSSSNPDVSLLNEVTIHELIHSVNVPGTQLRGFAANDFDDEEATPDFMYLTDGTQEIINAVTGTVGKKGDYSYTVKANAVAGTWRYVRISVPAKMKGLAIESVKRKDGEDITANAWLTWATMKDDQLAVHEDVLHLLDNGAADEAYTIVFAQPEEVVEVKDIVMSDKDGYEESYNGKVTTRTKKVKKVEIFFNKDDVDGDITAAVKLTLQGSPMVLAEGAVKFIDGKLVIDLDGIEGDGFYNLTVDTKAFNTIDGVKGNETKTIGWMEQTGASKVTLTIETAIEGVGSATVDGEEPAIEYEYGKKLMLKADKVEGYEFKGWMQNGMTIAVEEKLDYTIAANTMLTMNYAPESYRVTVIEDDGGAVAGGGTGIYEYDEEITLTAVAKPGYVFEGWKINEQSVPQSVARRKAAAREAEGLDLGSPTITYKVDGKVTLQPIFEKIEEAEAGDSRTLGNGWNWISSNLDRIRTAGAFIDLFDLEEGALQRMQSMTQELVYDEQLKLVGNLSVIEPTAMYKVNMKNEATVQRTGLLCSVRQTWVTLDKGWNWMGYLPNDDMTVEQALQELEAEDGDKLVGFDRNADYSGGEWHVPDGFKMEAGQGYMYYSVSGNRFRYPVSVGSSAQVQAKSHGQQHGHESWSVDHHRYPNRLPVVAQLMCDGHNVGHDYTVGAFCDGECRGVGQMVDDRVYINVCGEHAHDRITFYAMDNATGEILEVSESVEFGSGAIGSYAQPFALTLDGATVVTGPKAQAAADGNYYNLQGVKVDNLRRGVYIKASRKVVVK